MNADEAKTLLLNPVFKQFAEGKPVQTKNYCHGWLDDGNPSPFSFIVQGSARVKPQPRQWKLCVECKLAMPPFENIPSEHDDHEVITVYER